MIFYAPLMCLFNYPPHTRVLLSLEGPFTNPSSPRRGFQNSPPPPIRSGRAGQGRGGRAGGEGCSLCQVLLALCISWLLCFVLTVTSTFPSAPTAYGYLARTDTKGSVLSQAPWFRFPYPGNEKMQTLLAGDTLFPRTAPGAGGGLLQGIWQRGAGPRESISDPREKKETPGSSYGSFVCVCWWGGG